MSPLVLTMLNLLSEVCDAVASRATLPATKDDADDYKVFLEILGWRIRTLPIPKPSEDGDGATMVLQLYQLAMLVYLDQGSEGLLDEPMRKQGYVNEAFDILRRLDFCKQQFPIHIIGCEARTDEQRAVILDIISRSEKTSSSRSYNYCRLILQAVWAQNDLAYGSNIKYSDMMTSVMGHCRILPTYV
jgi:hypothetical protein